MRKTKTALQIMKGKIRYYKQHSHPAAALRSIERRSPVLFKKAQRALVQETRREAKK